MQCSQNSIYYVDKSLHHNQHCLVTISKLKLHVQAYRFLLFFFSNILLYEQQYSINFLLRNLCVSSRSERPKPVIPLCTGCFKSFLFFFFIIKIIKVQVGPSPWLANTPQAAVVCPVPSWPQIKVSRREACLGSSYDRAILGDVADVLAVVTSGPVSQGAFAGKVCTFPTSERDKTLIRLF